MDKKQFNGLTDCWPGVEKGDEQNPSGKSHNRNKSGKLHNHNLLNLRVWIGQSQSCLPSFWSWRLMTSSVFKRRFLGDSSPDSMGQNISLQIWLPFPLLIPHFKNRKFRKKKTTWKASVINWYNVWYDHFIFTSFLRFISSFAGNIMSTYLLLDPMSPRSSSRLHRWANAKWNSNASLLSLFAWHDAFLKSCLSIKSKGDLECDKHKFVAFWGMLQRDQFQRIWNINMTWLTVQKCSNISSRTTSTQKFCVAEELPGMRS